MCVCLCLCLCAPSHHYNSGEKEDVGARWMKVKGEELEKVEVKENLEDEQLPCLLARVWHIPVPNLFICYWLCFPKHWGQRAQRKKLHLPLRTVESSQIQPDEWQGREGVLPMCPPNSKSPCLPAPGPLTQTRGLFFYLLSSLLQFFTTTKIITMAPHFLPS